MRNLSKIYFLRGRKVIKMGGKGRLKHIT
jgi:hypothetical protein